MDILVVLVIILLLLFFGFCFTSDNFNRLPPGPLRVPVFGSLSLYKYGINQVPPYKAFMDLCKKYGPIITVKFGLTLQVIVDDPETIREVLTGENWIDRPDNPILNRNELGETGGIIMTNGEKWKELRRFSIRTLRDFGFGKQKSQEVIMEEELADLLLDLDQTLKETNIVDMHQFFTISVLNIIWSMIAGVRFSRKDEKIQQLLKKVSSLMATTSLGGNILLGFPFFRHFLSIFPTATWKARTNALVSLRQDFKDILIERQKKGMYKVDQRDFIDVFLTQIDRHEEKKYPIYTGKEFASTVMDLFVAGSETTSNTCEFAIMFMILNPDVQRNVQAEIDNIMGRNRYPTAADRFKLPYTDATTHEIQRLANVAPLIPRSPTKDVALGFHKIKQGTFVILNTYSLHLNPSVWKNPTKFEPKRFLDSKNKIVNTEKLLVFGGGKRLCLGEVLARATLFTYFATLMQNYTFEASSAHASLSIENVRFGLTIAPTPFFVSIRRR